MTQQIINCMEFGTAKKAWRCTIICMSYVLIFSWRCAPVEKTSGKYSILNLEKINAAVERRGFCSAEV